MAEGDSWDAESFEPGESSKKPAVLDKWEGEDEDDDVRDNWDDEVEESKGEAKKAATKQSKKKLSERIKEKENLERKKEEELRKKLEESAESTELTPEEELPEKLRVQKLQEEADLELANEAFVPKHDVLATNTHPEVVEMVQFVKIVESTELTPEEEEKLQGEADLKLANEAIGVSNNVTGIDAISPSSKDDFTEFERLLKDKISPYEKSLHYSSFLESLFRDLCLSLEVEDLKKINTSITALLSEKQKQEKQLNKGKKKKKGIVPAGGLKAKMKDDLDDYGEFDGGYVQDYEDFM